MDLIFSIVAYLFIGFFGLIAILFLLAMLFGKRVDRRFDLEAKFFDESGKEIAEFDTTSWRYQKEGGDFLFEATFRWRCAELRIGDEVEVYLDDQLILKGIADSNENLFLGEPAIQTKLESADEGQMCRVMMNQTLIMQEPVVHD